MAEPTVWGFTAVAGQSNSFEIEAANLYGVDISGALVPVKVALGDNMILLLTATKTNAEIVAAMQSFIQRYGAGHEGAGGAPTQATLQVAPALTETA
jgi:hypothetical protein